MALLGGRDSRDLVVWTGVDAAELRKFALQDGTTFDTVVGLLDGALTALNAELNADPLYAGLIGGVTDNPEVSYRMGAPNGFSDYDEYTRPDPNRAEVDGHMLPLKAADYGMRWTWDYLRKAYSTQIDADIADAVQACRDIVRKRTLGRLVKRADDSGKNNGLGTGGYSPGFATAAANTAVDYAPPAFNGKAFDTSHDHYAFAGSSLTSAQMVTNMKHLREHGHTAPYDLLISELDEAAVRAFTDFIPATDPVIQYGANANTVNLAGGYIGYLTASSARVRIAPGWPQNYTFMFKNYGQGSQLNPLRVRVQKGAPARWNFMGMPDPRQGGVSPANPLGTLILWTEFGVGVGPDRTNGVAHRNNASWADGTVS